MNGNFKVGEVLVGVGFINDTCCNGMECTVIEALQVTLTFESKTHRCLGENLVHLVTWADGCTCYVAPQNLRRKQPPSGELSILNMFVVAPPQRTKEIA